MDGPHFSVPWGGLGPIPDKQQPANKPWHHPWQAWMQSMYAQLFTKTDSGFNPGAPTPFFGLNAARWSRETMSPSDNISGGYYGNWLTAVCSFVNDYGPQAIGIHINELIRLKICTSQQVERNKKIRQIAFDQQVPGIDGPTNPGQLAGLYQSNIYDPMVVGSIEEIGKHHKFQVGDRIRVLKHVGNWYTRCYPYIQGCDGTITVYYGLSEGRSGQFDGLYHGPYPEVASQSRQKFFTPVYGVRFKGTDVFGEVNIDPRLYVHIDLWEPHMELA
jgi:hypothetical protein